MVLLLPDVSEWQPSADLGGIGRVNGGAAVIRAAYGTGHADWEFTRFRAAASGFRFLGIYQYLVAGEDAAAQAGVFCSLVHELGPHEVPVCDLEEGDGDQSGRFGTWASVVESRLGKRPWLYSGEAFAQEHGLAPLFSGSEYHTWVAAYGDAEPALGHVLWQCTDGTTGPNRTDWPGAGFCDTNVYRGTLGQLAVLAAPPPPKPPPAPAPPAPAKEDPMFIPLPHAERVVLAPWAPHGQPEPYAHLALVLAGETGAQVTATVWRGSESFPHVHDLASGTAVDADPPNGWAGVTMITLARTDTSGAQASAILTRW